MKVWATSKNLRINQQKTREMVVVKRSKASLASLPSITGVKRATSMKILGITIGERLTVSEHVDKILCSCASSLYALRVLRDHGMPAEALHLVSRATTVARLLYASPAWWGLLSAEEVDRIERFMRRVKRTGFLPPDAPSANCMAETADTALFADVIRDRCHVLRKHFLERPVSKYNLRPRPHPFELTSKNNRSYISRMLFKNIC